MPKLSLYLQIKLGMYKVTRKAPAHIRFWRDLDKNGPVHPIYGKCWTWLRGRLSKCCPYGHISVKHRAVRVHRYSWVLHFGKIPQGLHVLHKCDNPLCVNPFHLFLGDEAANKSDMVQKDRQAKGEECSTSKLTRQQVEEIKRRYGKFGRNGEGSKKLSDAFGVSRTAILYIVTGRNWKHVQ